MVPSPPQEPLIRSILLIVAHQPNDHPPNYQVLNTGLNPILDLIIHLLPTPTRESGIGNPSIVSYISIDLIIHMLPTPTGLSLSICLECLATHSPSHLLTMVLSLYDVPIVVDNLVTRFLRLPSTEVVTLLQETHIMTIVLPLLGRV